VPSRPLLQGDEGTFTFQKYPRIQGIFLVWTHTWMFFTSHIFTSLPLVHTPNPDFWGNIFDLASSRFASLLFIETSKHHNLWIWSSIDSRISQIPVPDLRRFVTSGLRRFKIPDLRRFATSGLRRFEIPDLHRFATSGLRRFTIPDLRRFNAPEKLISWILSNPTFWGWQIFPEFPNTSQSSYPLKISPWSSQTSTLKS
jgi:hypothetical protein